MKDDEKIIYEKCIRCGKETDIPVTKHIDFRDYYVEGAGQLCADCYKEIYGNKK